jgi:hypothetical protein
MTPQELFDAVVAHLRKQGVKSLLTQEQSLKLFVPPGTCAYLSFDGNKCAAGGLLLSEEYSPNLEGKNVLAVMDMVPSFKARIGYSNCNLLNDLRLVHDRHEVGAWEYYFEKVAQEHHLTYTPPTTP